MSKVNIDEEHDPKTAVFWAMFADEPGQQEEHCPTVTLYENLEGEFFAIERSPGVDPTSADLIEDPREWLDERFKWFEDNAIFDYC